MTSINVGGVAYDLLADGRLANIEDWNEDIAKALAQEHGITLSDDHWEIISLMRGFYEQYNISPIRKLLMKGIKEKCGADKANKDYLDKLFPNNVLVEGTLIAGLPAPMLDAEMDASATHSRARSTTGKAVASSSNHFIGEFEFEGATLKVSDRGNLEDSSQWNEKVAAHMAEKDGVKLSDEHWEVINFLRKFYFEYGVTPMVRLLMKYMKEQCGPEKSSEKYLYQLFPGGPARQGSRIAGLPEPQGCID
jgi:TusE/DsrC/DsvC family sulfur relay protein